MPAYGQKPLSHRWLDAHTLQRDLNLPSWPPSVPTGVSPHDSPRGIHVHFSSEQQKSSVEEAENTHSHMGLARKNGCTPESGEWAPPPKILDCTGRGHTCSAARVCETQKSQYCLRQPTMEQGGGRVGGGGMTTPLHHRLP